MKKVITAKIKELIKVSEDGYAQNYIVRKLNTEFLPPEKRNKVQADAAESNMASQLETIKCLKTLLKQEADAE